MENNKLQHWGIKGMKWGRRRYQNRDGSLTPEGRARYDDDGDSAKPHADYVKAHTRRDVSTMSTKELNDQLARMDAERRYKEATMTKGDKFKRWLAKSATEVGSQVAKEYAAKALRAGVDVGLSKIGSNVDSEGVKTFLKKMGADIKPKKAANDTPKVDNTRDTRKTRDKRETNENPSSDSSANASAKAQSKAEAKAAKKQAKAEAKSAKQQTNENDTSKPGSKNQEKAKSKEEPKKTYEADEILKKAYESPSADFRNFKNRSGGNKTIYSDDFEDKSSTPKKTNSAPALAAPAKKTYESPSVEKVPAREIGSGNLNDSQKSMIKALRASGGMTVSEVANAVGVSPSTVSRYTAGSAKPKKKEEKD